MDFDVNIETYNIHKKYFVIKYWTKSVLHKGSWIFENLSHLYKIIILYFFYRMPDKTQSLLKYVFLSHFRYIRAHVLFWILRSSCSYIYSITSQFLCDPICTQPAIFIFQWAIEISVDPTQSTHQWKTCTIRRNGRTNVQPDQFVLLFY